MALATYRFLASGCAALLVFSFAGIAVDARAAAVIVAKHEKLLHSTVGEPVTESYSPFFTHHTNGTPFLPADGWAPIAEVKAGDPLTAASTTPKKSFSFVGNSTAAGNWTDGNGVPAGITLTFDAQFTISAIRTTEPTLMLTVPGSLDDVGPPSNTRLSGRGFGLTVVPGGADDINNGRGLAFSPVTVSNVSFSGTLAEPGFTFTGGGVSGFGTELFESGQLNENSVGMTLIQGLDNIVDPGEETIIFGQTGVGQAPGTLGSGLIMNTNWGIFDDRTTIPNLPLSSNFARQSGPYTMTTTAGSAATFRGMVLGYDVTYDISPAGALEDADFNVDGAIDGNDFLIWQRNTSLTTGATLAQGDANGDGAVNAADLNIWKGQFGSPAVIAATVVPEPSTALLALAAAIGVAKVRRGRRALDKY